LILHIKENLHAESYKAIYMNNILCDEGIIVAETGKSEDLSEFENFIIKKNLR